ncbi:DNA mismatch repair protein MutT [Candidatus Levyibacteriota bacterium]|nr:NUDIX domain-containing protein [Candidatus Levybacteria bacterium]GDX62274.1 DNA mismatch repair protein MutT [Candidatus Levybacteria bacterium]
MERDEVKIKSKPERLPEREFLETFKKVPRLAVNLLITDSDGRILLARRNIPPFSGSWHFPGSFLLKDEPIVDAQRRVARDEFSLELDEGIYLSLLGTFDDLDGDPRGHVVDLAYGLVIEDPSQIKTTRETSEVKFFDKDKLPKDIGFNHRNTLHKLGYKDEE